MADVKMVIVSGVRYRPEDAPKDAQQEDDGSTVEHKMRTPRKTAARKRSE